MPHLYINEFLRQCGNDREIKDAIRDLKQALTYRQIQRLHDKIYRAITPLGTPEREAILKNHIEDPVMIQKLHDAKIATLSGTLTIFGTHVATILKRQREERETMAP